MVNSDYPVEAILILLNRECTLTKYFHLIPDKESVVENLLKRGCRTKSDCMALTDEDLLDAGLADPEAVRLFRRFLVQYDPKPKKLREAAAVAETEAERNAFGELFQLPGVKSTRAKLYFRAGFCSLADIAASTPDEIIERTAQVIQDENLDCIVPLKKEVRTHIAVAKAFTGVLTE